MQQGLCEIDGKIQLHDSRVDLTKKRKNNGLTDKGSQTDDFNVIRESYNKNVRSHFTDHVISSNELCNHYTGFPSVVALNPDFEYLDHGINSKKVVLYNYQKIKNDFSAAGIPRKLNHTYLH